MKSGISAPGTVVELIRPSLRGRSRVFAGLVFWSIVQAIPTFLSGRLIASALDDGFLAGRSGPGIVRLVALAASVVVGAWGTSHTYRGLASLVEPLRDDLVDRTVNGTLRNAMADGGTADAGGVARLTHHVEIAREAYANVLIVGQTFAVSIVSALVGLVTLAPLTLVFIVPPLLAGLALFVVLLTAMAGQQRASILASERIAESTATVAHGLRDVVACGAEDLVFQALDDHVTTHADATVALARLTGLRTLSVAVGGLLPVVLILASGSWLIDRGLSTGAVVGALTYLLQGIHPALQSLVRELGNTALWLAVVSRRIGEAAPLNGRSRDGWSVGNVAAPATADLKLTDVTFAYGPAAAPVIRRLNLDVPHGDHLAIIGPSGVGKSTLANLLAGLLRPVAGTVTVGGVPVQQLGPEGLADHRVLIPQETYVFAGTLRENLTYYRPDATDDEITAAVAELGIGALVRRIGGLGAQLHAVSLSGGERQLITLARAFLAPTPIVVLDEASCYLDAASEARVEEAFARRPGTLIVIAHRMTSAYRARRVLVMDGDQAAIGSHDELLARSPLYAGLAGHWQ